MTRVTYKFSSLDIANEFMSAIDNTHGRAVATPPLGRRDGKNVRFFVLVGLFAESVQPDIDRIAAVFGGTCIGLTPHYPAAVHQRRRKAA